MVKSSKIYTPQKLAYILVGEAYIFNGHDVVGQLEDILSQDGEEYVCSFPLESIEEIVNNKINVVLVDVSGFTPDSGYEIVPMYRWFEVPENFEDLERASLDSNDESSEDIDTDIDALSFE